MTTELVPLPATPTIDAGALMSLALEKGATIDVIERLMTIRTQLQQEYARKAFFAALSTFQGKCPVIFKNKAVTNAASKGGGVRYYYAPMEAIQRAISGLLIECGLSFRFETSSTADSVSVTCIVSHKDGHSESTAFVSNIDPAAFMNLAQKFGSALTFGKRYALCNGLGIISGDQDDDANSLGDNEEKTPQIPIVDDAPWPVLAKDDAWKAHPAPDDDNWRSLGDLSEAELLPLIKANVTNGGYNTAVTAACARLLSNTAKARGYDKSASAIKVTKFSGPEKLSDYTAADLFAAYEAVLALPIPTK